MRVTEEEAMRILAKAPKRPVLGELGVNKWTTLSEMPKPAKRQKFNAQKTQSGGRTFASKKEASRYQALLLRLKAGEIRRLECQPVYVMHTENEAGEWIACGKFTLDFRYQERNQNVILVALGREDEWNEVVEDVKGGKATRTEAYVLRRKHVEAEYGIRIIEI